MVGWERILPILCQFGVGGVLCLVGIIAGLKSGYLDFKLAADRRLILIILGGFTGLLILNCVFTFWLPHVAVEVRQ